MKIIPNSLALLVLCACSAVPFNAQADKLNGTFIASDGCEAFKSIRKGSNPGKVRLQSGKRYKVVKKNKSKASHYQVEIPGIKTPLRWVSVSCGALKSGSFEADRADAKRDTAKSTTVKAQPKASEPKVAAKPKESLFSSLFKKSGRKAKPGDYLLALSWQPGFCSGNRNKRECRNARNSDISASAFSLHGLWPQPRSNVYCGVSSKDKTIDKRSRWDRLKALKLSRSTKNALQQAMPGFASNLQRHEWIKHGTCYGTDADTYYRDSMRLQSELNLGPLDELFVKSRGKKLTLRTVQATITKHFGIGAGKRVAIRCGKSGQINELWLALRGDISGGDSLKTLLKRGKAPRSNCKSGTVRGY